MAGFVFEVVSAAVVVGVPGWWLARHADLGWLAGTQATAALGRRVAIESLKLGFGDPVTIELSGGEVANIPGAAAPAAVTVKRLSVALDRRALLSGRVLVETASVDGLSILLEKTAERVPNWRFGADAGRPDQGAGSGSEERSRFPSLRQVHATDSQVIYRVESGRDLVTKLDQVGITTVGDDQPVGLTIEGSYNGTPVAVDAELASINALRDVSRPFPTKLHFTSGPAQLVFRGTMTDPLNFDGLDGQLALDANDPKPVFELAGLDTAVDAAVHLYGPFQHKGPGWRLEDLHGQLGTDEVTRAAIDFEEGAYQQPDRLALDVAFASLNLNDLLGSGAKGHRSGADLSLAVSPRPSTLLRAKVTAGRFDYAAVVATDVAVDGEQAPGRVAINSLSMNTLGTKVVAHGAIEAVGEGGTGHLTAEAATNGAEVQGLGRALGFGTLPLVGRMDVDVVADAVGRTLNVASRGARISAVAAMRGGSVQKQVVQKASTDLRALFGADRGWSAITCVIAGLDMRGGIGTVAPLRLRAADGTISGSARFDLNRKTFDLTVGSEARTTGPLALDIPIRVYGSFGDPTVRPAQWSAEGRALLASADSMAALPPALREWARRYPCPR